MARVGDLLRSKDGGVVTVALDADTETAVRLLLRHHIGGLPVVGPDGAAVGFIAERDVVQAVALTAMSIGAIPVARIMRRPAPACTADDSIHDVMMRMTRDRLRHLVVLEGGRPVGVISVGDLVKNRLEQLETEAGVLRDYVAAQRAGS
jgi:CBS domain-containing protein